MRKAGIIGGLALLVAATARAQQPTCAQARNLQVTSADTSYAICSCETIRRSQIDALTNDSMTPEQARQFTASKQVEYTQCITTRIRESESERQERVRMQLSSITGRCATLFQQNSIVEAADCLSENLSRYPESRSNPTVLALAHHVQDSLASQKFSRYRIWPFFPPAPPGMRYTVSDINGKNRQSEAYMQNMLSLDPSYTGALYATAMHYWGDPDRAIHYFERAAATSPNPHNMVYYRYLALVSLTERNRYADALRYLESYFAMNLTPYDSTRGMALRGEALVATLRTHDGILLLRQAQQRAPRDPEIRNAECNAFIAIKQYREASRCVDQVVAIDPQFGNAAREALQRQGLYVPWR